MRALFARGPAPLDHQEALAEHREMVETMDSFLERDPLAFQAPDFIAVRKGCRVLEAADRVLQALVKTPVPTDFDMVSEEYRSMMLIVNSCLTFDADALASPECTALRKVYKNPFFNTSLMIMTILFLLFFAL